MKTTPTKGMADYMPKEAKLREYMQDSILNSYKSYGFERIMTPIVEDIENLDKSDGGENLNLIFKILKRGDKLEKASITEKTDNLADLGLRYDLTLPLSRFYANNRNQLMLPFKCIQIDRVYRAERPQKGRMREFVQCDIDIIGSSSINCEIELIDATATALIILGLGNFCIKINDRRILNEVILACGFDENDVGAVCIAFDKLAKIGANGVTEELCEKNMGKAAIGNFSSFLEELPISFENVKKYCNNTQVLQDLQEIITKTTEISHNSYDIEFDISLVRGQGYYSGVVFEIESRDFNSAIAGGGRYDKLIGKFTGENIPAVGFSIGFERIFAIMSENNFKIPTQRKQIAIIYQENFSEAAKLGKKYRNEYDVLVVQGGKKLSRLIASLKEKGYYGICMCEKSQEIEILDI